VTLGAYDGCWRCRALTVTKDGTQKEEIRESQPAALLGWSINTTLFVSKTPGKAPQMLRSALLDLWRARPPSQADLRRARASLTPAPIPKLNVDRRTNVSKPLTAAVAVSQGMSTQDVSIPAVLGRLTAVLDPQDYFAPGNSPGVQVHVERTTAGFLVTLRGTSQQAHSQAKASGEPDKYQALARATIVAPISYQKLREYPNRRAVFAGILVSTTPNLRFVSAMAEAIADRLSREKPPETTATGMPMPPRTPIKEPKPLKTHSYSPDRFRGSPRSLKVTFTAAEGQQVTTHLSMAIAIIQDEDTSKPLVPYYTVHRRIMRGWDPRKAITTPRNITKEPTTDHE
jgi:hypothetical protein